MPDLRTFRPGGARVVAYGAGVAMIVITVVIGVALPSEITFTAAELATLAVLLIAVLAGLHAVGRSVVRAGEDALEVVNGYRRHVLPWHEIEGFSMTAGAPWPTVVTKDDERLVLFAIQGTDGEYARQAVEYLRGRLT